jgi:hypothetical protein
VAARSVRAQHGILSALDYLIGEKLLIYAETAVTRPEFARELPRFVAEVREMFSGEEIGHYLNHLERMAAIEDEQVGNQDETSCLMTPLTSVPPSGRAGAPRTAKGTTRVTCARDGVDEGSQLKLHATHVSVDDFADQYFQISFDTEDPGADLDLSAPLKPYLLVQRQFEGDDASVCYIETHEPDRYAGHFRVRLVEFAPSRLVFDIDRTTDRRVEVTFMLAPQRFQEIQRIVRIIFDVSQ